MLVTAVRLDICRGKTVMTAGMNLRITVAARWVLLRTATIGEIVMVTVEAKA
jgi:hypothetical protein